MLNFILEQEDLVERQSLLQDRSRRLQAEFDKLQFDLDKNEDYLKELLFKADLTKKYKVG